MDGSDSVLEKCCIMVHFVLDDRTQGENRSVIFLVIRETIAQELEGLVVLTKSDVEQANGRQKFGIFWVGVQAVGVNLQGFLVVENEAVDFPELQVRILIWVEIVGLLETLYGIVEMPQVSET